MSQFATIPAWTYEGKPPSKYTFFEAIALAGLEGKQIRLDANTQRLLLGFAVFGRRAITVLATGIVRCIVVVGFGMDYADAEWTAGRVQAAVDAKLQLHPDAMGRKYYSSPLAAV